MVENEDSPSVMRTSSVTFPLEKDDAADPSETRLSLLALSSEEEFPSSSTTLLGTSTLEPFSSLSLSLSFSFSPSLYEGQGDTEGVEAQ
jgi:hypothetical protein